MRRASALLAAVAAVVAGGPPQLHAQASEVTLVLQDQSFAVAPEQPWSASFVVEGDLAGILPAATTTTTTTTPLDPTTTAPPVAPTPVTSLRVVAHRPIERREELADVLAGDLPTTVDSVTIPVTLGAGSTLAVDVPTTTSIDVADALTLRLPGLHPLTVELLVDGQRVAEHLTFVERLPVEDAAGAPMNVAIVAAAPDPGPALTDDEVADGHERLWRIAELAAAVEGPITVQLPPVLLDGLASEDPRLAATLRDSLDGDEVLAIPADVLDPSSAVAIAAQDDFARELRTGEAVLTDILPSSIPQRAAWLVDTPISTDAAAMLADLGFRSLVLDQAIYLELDGNIAGYHDDTLSLDVDLGARGSLPAMVTDAGPSLLDPATLERSGMSPAAAAVEIVAELVTTRRDLGAQLQRSAVLTTPAGTVPDPDVAGAVARYATSMPDFRLAALSAVPSTTDTMIIGDTGPQTVFLPPTAGPDLTERSQRIELTRIAAAATGSMLLDDTQLETWQSELDTLLSTGLTNDEADVELDRIAAETMEPRSQVEAPAAFTFTLTGRSSPLRWTLRNNGDEAVRVVVRASSPKLTFPEGDQPVLLEPGSATEVVIPVEARTLGTSAIGMEVLTPELEQHVIEPVVLTARVNALTGLGQVVTGGAILVLGSWWFTHYRRSRRQRMKAIAALEQADELGAVSPDAAEVGAVPDQHSTAQH